MKVVKLKSIAILILSVFAFASCLKDNDNSVMPPVSGFTMINGYVENPGVFYKITRNGFDDPLFRIDYKSYLKNTSLYAGNRRLSIYSGHDNAKIIDTTYNFKDSTTYSGIIYGKPASAKFIITQDKPLANLGDKSALRFFHLANAVDAVNVSINDETTPLFTRTSQQDAASVGTNQTFVSRANGTVTITVKKANGDLLVKRENVILKPERYYTFILIGDAQSTTLPVYLGVVEH